MKDSDQPAPDPAPETEVIRLWDPLLRLFHWLLAGLVTASLITGHLLAIKTIHFQIGLAIGALLIFRVVWGFRGPEAARFRNFLYGPVSVVRYALGMPRREPSYWRGHSPTGGWATLLLILLLAAQVLSGMMADPEDYINQGPLAPLVGIDIARTAGAWHVFLSWFVLGFVLLHIAVIAFYARRKGENLVLPMILGRKRVKPADTET